MDALLELLKLAGVGVIAGLFSSWLSTRQHRHSTWWEMRVTAYQGAIEALSDLVYYYDAHYNAALEHRELPDDFKSKVDAFWDPAFHKIRKAADSGAFIFSAEANAALAEFLQRDYDPNDMYFEHLDKRLSAAQLCLGKLVALSRKDLSLKLSLLDRLP